MTLISWLRQDFLSNMVPQTLNNEVLADTVPLKNSFVRTVSEKNEKILVMILTIPVAYCIPMLVCFKTRSRYNHRLWQCTS